MSAQLHLVIGAGAVGTAVARAALERGDTVRVLTRSGSGLDDPRVDRIRGDATDVKTVTHAALGTVAIYNCANPPYHRWPQEWPPIAAALLEGARRSGAVLATVSNLYGYGPVQGPITEDLPLAATGSKGRVRAQMWLDALAAHEASEIRATEVRGSDYLGKGSQSQINAAALKALRRGRPVRVLGALDVPHSWTFTGDVGRTLVAAATSPAGWGRPWHVPSAPACTVRELVADLARVAGVTPVPVRRVPPWIIRGAAPFVPILRELPEVDHQHTRPWVLDSTAAERHLGVTATPWDLILRDHLS